MWNSFDDDDSTAGGKGGFFNANQYDSPQANKKSEKVTGSQSVYPVCIRQIQDHPGEEFKPFGAQTQFISIVGILRQYEVQSTKATYEIEDHTGTISAIWWLENDNTQNLPLVKEGCYLKVYGALRVQEGRKLLMVLRMFPVDDANVITTHLLEVIDARLQTESYAKGAPSRIQQNNPGKELVNSMSFISNNGTDVDNGYQSANGLTRMQEKVIEILRPATNEAGLSRDFILKSFPPNQHREVNAALEFLINEGHAYSTVDSDHFKATDTF